MRCGEVAFSHPVAQYVSNWMGSKVLDWTGNDFFHAHFFSSYVLTLLPDRFVKFSAQTVEQWQSSNVIRKILYFGNDLEKVFIFFFFCASTNCRHNFDGIEAVVGELLTYIHGVVRWGKNERRENWIRVLKYSIWRKSRCNSNFIRFWPFCCSISIIFNRIRYFYSNWES